VPYGYACRSGVRVIRDERHIRKTPRWWAVSPPTPAEAPQAKRRTAARSRGSIALILALVAAFVVSVLLLFFHVGRQVQRGEPVALSLGVSVVQVRPVPPAAESVPGVPEVADAAPAASGLPAVKRRPAREVFRKPGF
jgi:hypothetical protein